MKPKIILTLILTMHIGFNYSQEKLKIDTKTKEDVINRVATILQEKYVFADIGEKMAKFIIQQLEDGEYNSFKEIKPFCSKLTSDLRKISNDKHLFVFYSPEESIEVAARNNLLSPEETEKYEEYTESLEIKENYGFRKVEILKGNIGYMDIEYITGSVNVCSKVNNVLGFLKNTNAIIIDLRNNGGGGGGGVEQLLMSYFFGEEKVPFSGVYYREIDKIEENWSNPNIVGDKFPNIDLYILTSSTTFSAAECIAYDLQALNRAVIIGETTKGGAHPIDVFRVKGDVLTQISIGNSVNPITGTNWEETGVFPDIITDFDSALIVAHKKALEKIIISCLDKDYRDELIEILKELEVQK